MTELEMLGAFYGVATRPDPALDRYTEWVLGREAFAYVTLGPVEGRASTAAARWPAAITGVKRELGSDLAPTYYVRTLCPWAEGMAWLGHPDLPAARTLYGLGFQGEVVKTYALTDDGFVSYRLDGAGVHAEPKAYRADVAWDAIAWPDARWRDIGALGRSLGFRSAGHVGQLHGAMKIYVERIGAIATDRSFA